MELLIIYAGHQLDYLYGIISGIKDKEYNYTIIDSSKNKKLFDSIKSTNLHFTYFLDNIVKNKMLSQFLYYLQLIPYLIFKNKACIIHIEWLNTWFPFLDEIIFSLLKKFTKIKIVYKVHDISRLHLSEENISEKDVKLSRTKRMFFNSVDCFITHNQFVKNLLITNGISEKKVEVVPHGINNYAPINPEISIEYSKTKFRINSGDRVILFFGRISPNKNIESLIDAVDNLNNKGKYKYKLLIAGKFSKLNKTYQNKIEQLVKKDFITTEFGFISNEDIQHYFQAADIISLPYNFIYQSGLPFLAYRYGLPVIAKNTGGIPEDVDKHTGIIYNSDDELENTIEMFFNKKHSIYTKPEIQKHANEKYSWNAIGKKYEYIYSKI